MLCIDTNSWGKLVINERNKETDLKYVAVLKPLNLRVTDEGVRNIGWSNGVEILHTYRFHCDLSIPTYPINWYGTRWNPVGVCIRMRLAQRGYIFQRFISFLNLRMDFPGSFFHRYISSFINLVSIRFNVYAYAAA